MTSAIIASLRISLNPSFGWLRRPRLLEPCMPFRPTNPVRPKPLWVDPAPIPEGFPLRSLDPNPVVARLLYRRGLASPVAAHDFLDTSTRPAPIASELPNLVQATTTVAMAIAQGTGIGIFGDYDVDGLTSTTVLLRALRAATGDPDRVSAYIPSRDEGYGVNQRGVDALIRNGASLLIAVDCGSNDHDPIAYAQERGMEVIVLDHHRIAAHTPEGALVVSPQLLMEQSPLHDLTGVGVAWMLVSSLAQEGIHVAEGEGQDERSYLDLVALGTVADVAKLDHINRGLVRDGLKQLARTHRPGLRALMDLAKITPADVTSTAISFSLAPRINAAGRMAHPNLALNLLMEDEPARAAELAAELDAVNQRRKMVTDEVIASAYAQIVAIPSWEDRPLFALHDRMWPGGVLGAVASRLGEEFGRPVLLFRNDGGILHGSGRSVPGFDLVDGLHELDELMIRYGGHGQAAGVTLTQDNLMHLVDGLSEQIGDAGLPIPVPPRILIDDDLEESDLTIQTVHDIHLLEPFGNGNVIPHVRVRSVRLDRYSTMGKDGSHLRLNLLIGRRSLTALLWGGAERSRELIGARLADVVGILEINRWQGRESLQLVLDDFRVVD
ncbi:MAG: single-stranded-DNA-specific exonuclease RecJ [Thermomicrobiales bacterium]